MTTADAATSWWTSTDDLDDGADVRDVTITHDDRLLLAEVVAPSGDVRTRLQDDDGTWRTPVTLLDSGHHRSYVRTVVSAEETYVVWLAQPDSSGSYEVGGARLDGTSWVPLPSVPALESGAFDAAVSDDGEIVAAWLPMDQGGSDFDDLVLATLDGAAWQTTSTKLAGWSIHDLAMAVATDGTAIIAGTAFTDGVGYGVDALLFDGTAISSPHRLSNAALREVFRPRVARASTGIVVVFAETHFQGSAQVIRTATYADGAWEDPVDLWSGVDRPTGPALAVAPDGTAMIGVGRATTPAGMTLVSFEQAADSSWGPPETVTTISDLSLAPDADIDLSIGAEGTVIVTIVATDDWGWDILVAVIRGPGRPWSDPIVLDEIDGNLTDVHHRVEEDGLIHVVWYQSGWKWTAGFFVPFDDIEPGAFYSWPVLWAYDVGLTTGVGGTDEFQPNRSITRAEAITTLWRFADSPPAPPAGFDDVGGGTFYTAAVDWARDIGLTTGVGGANRFEPNRTITRAELVTLLWRLDGMESAPPGGFVDVPPGAFYEASVNWAKATGITTGVGGSNRFEPNRQVTRAEAFTFVYRLAASMDISAASGGATPFGPLELQQPIPLG